MSYERFAIYWLPQLNSDLARFGARWLGWDIAHGKDVKQFYISGFDLAALTKKPRRYGFHATLKPPFVLAQNQSIERLQMAIDDLAKKLCIFRMPKFKIGILGQILAIIPSWDEDLIQHSANLCVSEIDRFRHRSEKQDALKYSHKNLSDYQQFILKKWGYPYLFDAFSFHLTLSQPLDQPSLCALQMIAFDYAQDAIEKRAVFDQIALCGERRDGFFELISLHSC